METVYLSNGQACYLKEVIGSKFIVRKIYEYNEGDEWIQVDDGNDIVVDQIFYNPPVEKISGEIKELQATRDRLLTKIGDLNREKAQISGEIEQGQKTLISREKFIINRSEILTAKSLALFVKDRPLPILMDNDNKSFRGLKVSIEFELSSGGERKWGCQLYYDYPNSSDSLCKKYGILINPSQQEIDEVITKRLAEFKFHPHQLSRVDNKYLTPELIKEKNEYIASSKKKEEDDLEKKIKDLRERLNRLRDNQ